MQITAQKLKSSLSDDRTFYWFYIGIQLERTASDLSFDEIALVEYHLLHSTFPNPDIRVANAANGFQYKIWMYGFIKVSADIITKDGRLIKVSATPLSWPVSDEEIAKNGKSELSW